ncbi:MAG: thiamine-phosphate kinase [Planctomycetota bacterium]|jgi:thiamine-monophosphate kinase
MGAERLFTSRLGEFFGPAGKSVRVGIGDDAAVIAPPAGDMVVACDPTVESVHFEAGTSPAWVGRKAINRNLSDLAAMGARPDYALVSVLLPAGFTSRQRRSLFDGLRRAAAQSNCQVIGGDVGRSPGPLVVTVTVMGHLESSPMRRDRARVGDSLHLTGPLGGSGLGKHLRFTPRIREGLWLAGRGELRAAIDVSDGLVLDLQTVLEASGCPGAVLDAASLPLSPAARRAASSSQSSALEHALYDGEDYELLFVLAAGKSLPARGPLSASARKPIGRITKVPGIFLDEGGESLRRLEIRGYEHRV